MHVEVEASAGRTRTASDEVAESLHDWAAQRVQHSRTVTGVAIARSVLLASSDGRVNQKDEAHFRESLRGQMNAWNTQILMDTLCVAMLLPLVTIDRPDPDDSLGPVTVEVVTWAYVICIEISFFCMLSHLCHTRM